MNEGHLNLSATGQSVADDVRANLAFQTEILQGVSRTFALTIPQLPPPLKAVVGNAYLLCRIADTIEDAEELDGPTKQSLAGDFVDVVAGRMPGADFAQTFYALLDSRTPVPERELALNTARVVALTHSFNDCQRDALERCVAIMSRGMSEYQQAPSLAGLASQAELDRYCYFVAGVVGEMLTELFCDHCADMASEREILLKLSVEFGQALQMTNILKDMWEDRRRGVCWLPSDVFRRHGVELVDLRATETDPGFAAAMDELIGIAHQHVRAALEYTLHIPARENGMRRFCLWALGMAVMTLRKLHAHPDFAAGKDVKIKRRTVKATVAFTSAIVNRDTWLRWSLRGAAHGLPEPPPHYEQADVSCWKAPI